VGLHPPAACASLWTRVCVTNPNPCLSPVPSRPAVTLPAGVVVGPGGVLCDESGAPLPRGLKFVDGTIVAAASGSQLPKSECHPQLYSAVQFSTQQPRASELTPHCLPNWQQ
jgi:hypothetical protein